MHVQKNVDNAFLNLRQIWEDPLFFENQIFGKSHLGKLNFCDKYAIFENLIQQKMALKNN